MARIAQMVLASLSLFLGMFFFFFGLIKVSRGLNADIHREMRRNFVRYAKVVPVLTTHLGWRVSPHPYRLLVGYAEIIAGLLLAFCPGRTKQWCNLFLICLCLGAIYTHLAVLDDHSKMIPAVAFGSMLVTRLILYFLLKRIPNDDYDDNDSTRPPAAVSQPLLAKSESDESENLDSPSSPTSKVKIIKVIDNQEEPKNYLTKIWSWFGSKPSTKTITEPSLVPPLRDIQPRTNHRPRRPRTSTAASGRNKQHMKKE